MGQTIAFQPPQAPGTAVSAPVKPSESRKSARKGKGKGKGDAKKGKGEKEDDEDESDSEPEFKEGEVVARVDESGAKLDASGTVIDEETTTVVLKTKASGRERREKLKSVLLQENDTYVPKLGETLTVYYARTVDYWTKEAFQRETDNVGKALRREGFELAKEKFEQMQPILQELKDLEQLSSGDEADDKGKGAAGAKKGKEAQKPTTGPRRR